MGEAGLPVWRGIKNAYGGLKAGGPAGAVQSVAFDTVEDIAKSLRRNTNLATKESLARTLVGKQRDNVIKALIASSKIGTTPPLVDPVVKALLLSGGAASARNEQ
ncbi:MULTISPECIES: hypothetical protein [unclassified Sinorhizobium]|uniref:hypothetical protein n=1 Tax=unclassified Sinorhizobium TaxID=2613772 RepID=UPI0035268226